MFSTKQMSASFLRRSRWLTWCSNETSIAVMSFSPAADMQRTIHRLNALPAMMSAYSSSDSSALVSDTRCSEETILVGWRDMVKILEKQDGKVSGVYDEPSIPGSLAKTLIDKLLIFY